jgi:leader peptidase (prepilin peptidase)/N-methyltransferase
VNLTPLNAAALGALEFGLVAICVLIPLAKLIPKRLRDQWQAEVEFEMKSRQSGTSVEYSFTLIQTTLLVIGAAIVGAFVLWKYGTELHGIPHTVYFLCLVLLLAINLKHELLPDVVVLPALWAGLLFQASSGNASPAIYGAAAGYLAPFLVGVAFKMFTGKEVIGQGDMKALSMAGAWFGLSAIPTLFGAFLIALFVWAFVAKLIAKELRGVLPTGPAHLVASLAVASGASAF